MRSTTCTSTRGACASPRHTDRRATRCLSRGANARWRIFTGRRTGKIGEALAAPSGGQRQGRLRLRAPVASGLEQPDPCLLRNDETAVAMRAADVNRRRPEPDSLIDRHGLAPAVAAGPNRVGVNAARRACSAATPSSRATVLSPRVPLATAGVRMSKPVSYGIAPCLMRDCVSAGGGPCRHLRGRCADTRRGSRRCERRDARSDMLRTRDAAVDSGAPLALTDLDGQAKRRSGSSNGKLGIGSRRAGDIGRRSPSVNAPTIAVLWACCAGTASVRSWVALNGIGARRRG